MHLIIQFFVSKKITNKIAKKARSGIISNENLVISRPTVSVTGAGAGVDSVGEQRKPEARKMLENAAESHTSGARFVGRMDAENLFIKVEAHCSLFPFDSI